MHVYTWASPTRKTDPLGDTAPLPHPGSQRWPEAWTPHISTPPLALDHHQWIPLNQESLHGDHFVYRRTTTLFPVFLISWPIFLRSRIWKNINVPKNAQQNCPWKDSASLREQKSSDSNSRFFLLYEKTQPGAWLVRSEGVNGTHWGKSVPRYWALETWI